MIRNQKLHTFWNKMLQHPINKDMTRLSLLGVISKSISNVVNPLPCAACIFDIACSKAWRNKEGISKRVDKGDDKPGNRTSYDYIISKKSVLISKVSKKLTNHRFNRITILDLILNPLR